LVSAAATVAARDFGVRLPLTRADRESMRRGGLGEAAAASLVASCGRAPVDCEPVRAVRARSDLAVRSGASLLLSLFSLSS
jgi:hypothetical protein